MWRTLDTIVMDEVATFEIMDELQKGPAAARSSRSVFSFRRSCGAVCAGASRREHREPGRRQGQSPCTVLRTDGAGGSLPGSCAGCAMIWKCYCSAS